MTVCSLFQSFFIQQTKRLVFAAILIVTINAQRPPLRIVHLGDSYSAGNGARRPDGSKDFHSVEGCFRSQSNWGSRFAQSLTDVFSVVYVNRACSGAKIADIQNERLLKSKFDLTSCPKPKYPDEEDIRKEALSKCNVYIRPQIEAIDESTDIVLLTIGGNDAGFANIIKQCYVSISSLNECKKAIDNAQNVLDEFGKILETTLLKIGSRMKKSAKFVLVTYPHLTLNVRFDVVEIGIFSKDTLNVTPLIRGLGTRADNVQLKAVTATNTKAGRELVILFDQTKDLFNTHEPHPAKTKTNPMGWIIEFRVDAFVGKTSVTEFYHPNAIGHEKWGQALSILEAEVDVPDIISKNGNVDMVFVIDSTGSMSDEIETVRINLKTLVDQLSTDTSSWRVAVVSYRDFPERTGSDEDFPSKIVQPFTDNVANIEAALDNLIASGGGDFSETVLSGIKTSIDLNWRPAVTKVSIVIGDASAILVSGAEPISGLTPQEIIAESIAVDPVQVFAVDVGSLLTPELELIVTGTGGEVVNGAENLIAALSDVITKSSEQPFAWFGSSIVGKIGEPILFDAQGSYDPSGAPLKNYEWDFNGDDIFDVSTTKETVEYSYNSKFEGFVILRVTGSNGTALASARVVVNLEGSVSQGDEEPCELDDEGYSIYIDANGTLNNSCTATRIDTRLGPNITIITEDTLEPTQTATIGPVPIDPTPDILSPTFESDTTPDCFDPSAAPVPSEETVVPSESPEALGPPRQGDWDEFRSAKHDLFEASKGLPAFVFRLVRHIRNTASLKDEKERVCYLIGTLRVTVATWRCQKLDYLPYCFSAEQSDKILRIVGRMTGILKC